MFRMTPLIVAFALVACSKAQSSPPEKKAQPAMDAPEAAEPMEALPVQPYDPLMLEACNSCAAAIRKRFQMGVRFSIPPCQKEHLAGRVKRVAPRTYTVEDVLSIGRNTDDYRVYRCKLKKGTTWKALETSIRKPKPGEL